MSKRKQRQKKFTGVLLIPRSGEIPPGVQYQLGGQRKNSKGEDEYLVIPVINGEAQIGGSFWSKAWNWVKKGAKAVGDVAKKVAKDTGVLSKAAKHIPVVGDIASSLIRQAGYGQRGGRGRGRGRIVRSGNALHAAR